MKADVSVPRVKLSRNVANAFYAMRAHCRHYDYISYNSVPGYIEPVIAAGLAVTSGNGKGPYTYRLTNLGDMAKIVEV